MTLAEQVRVEVVHVAALLAADVALPGVGVAVAALVQEVQRGVGERNGAECTYERGGQQRRVAVRRCYTPFRRRRSRRLQLQFHCNVTTSLKLHFITLRINCWLPVKHLNNYNRL